MRLGYATGAAVSTTALVLGLSALSAASAAPQATTVAGAQAAAVPADDPTSDPTETTPTPTETTDTPSPTETTPTPTETTPTPTETTPTPTETTPTPTETTPPPTSTTPPPTETTPPPTSTTPPPSQTTPPPTHTTPGSGGSHSGGSSGHGAPTPKPHPAMRLSGSAWLSHDVKGNGRVDAGDQVSYSFTLTNTGNVPLSAASVGSPNLSRLGASVSCPSTSFGPGASVTCGSSPVTTTAFQAQHGGLNITAKGAATSSTGKRISSNGDTVTVGVALRTAPPRKLFARMSLTESVAGMVDHNHNGVLDEGDEVRFAYTIRNTGAAALSGILISSDKFSHAGVKVSCGTTSLASGASTTCQSTALVLNAGQASRGLGKTYAKALAVTSDGRQVHSNVATVDVQRVIPGAKPATSTLTWNPWPDGGAIGSLIGSPSERVQFAANQQGTGYDVGSDGTPVLLGLGGALAAGLAWVLVNRRGRRHRRRMWTTLRTAEQEG